jgi:hypothetical protein
MTDLINFIKQFFTDVVTFFQDVLTAILTWFQDVFLTIFELMMNGVVYIFALLEPPEFLSTGLDSAFTALPDDLTYFLSQSGLAAGLALYGAGVSFRLLRKLFTLGQW